MYKKNGTKLASSILSIFLLSSLLFTSTIFSSFNITSQQTFAQPVNHYKYKNDSYDNNDNNYVPSSYSKYPSDDKKYECRTGPFEGFFVSSVEFCKHVKFDDRKDHRDNRTGAQGPPGPQAHKAH